MTKLTPEQITSNLAAIIALYEGRWQEVEWYHPYKERWVAWIEENAWKVDYDTLLRLRPRSPMSDVMDTECIERIRTAGEKAEAKLNDMKGEVEKAFREGYELSKTSKEYIGRQKECWLSSRARRVVEGGKV